MHRPSRRILLAVVLVALIAPLIAASVRSTATADLHEAARAAATTWKQVSAGENHTCAVHSTGRLYCWGRNDYGQLGSGSQDPATIPTEVVGGHTNWTSVSAGGDTTCGLRSSRRLYCWGGNSFGQLGDGTDGELRTAPTQVWGNRTDWTAVSAANGHVCARRASGRLFCWGYNSEGQVGDGSEETKPLPTQVAGNRTDWVLIDTGGESTCARRSNGRLFCWGYNGDGQVGDGTTARRLKPTQVSGRRTDWATVDTANHHVCATRTTGRLFCWGDGLGGQLGTGATELRLRPTQVSGSRTDWRNVTLGYDHTCARRSTGRIFCWGYNNNHELGDGTTDDSLLPTEVAGDFTDWRALDAGSSHTCARRATGQVYCWGYNSFGQVGDATNDPRATPTEVTLG